MKYSQVFFAVLISFLCFCKNASAASVPYHPPNSAAENVVYDALTGKNVALTKELSAVILAAQKERQGGKCQEQGGGLLCEIAEPIFCTMEKNANYIFKTVDPQVQYKTEDTAYVSVLDTEYGNYDIDPSILYRLILKDGNWQIDGIDCGGLYKYNLPTDYIMQVYHRAQSEPEKILEKILLANAGNEYDIYGLVFYPDEKHEKEKPFLNLFTENFLKQAFAEQRELVQSSCGGKASPDGRACDDVRDYDPLKCAHDFPSILYFTTLEESDDKVTILFGWPYNMDGSGSRYTMVKNNDQWQLDKACLDGYDDVHIAIPGASENFEKR